MKNLHKIIEDSKTDDYWIVVYHLIFNGVKHIADFYPLLGYSFAHSAPSVDERLAWGKYPISPDEKMLERWIQAGRPKPKDRILNFK